MNHHACMEHPHQRTTKRIGNWLVFGPKHEDGTEWSLCTCTEDGAHLRCVGSFARQADAERIPFLEGAIRAQEAMIRAGLEPLGCPDPLYDHHAVEWAAEEIQVLRTAMEKPATQQVLPPPQAAKIPPHLRVPDFTLTADETRKLMVFPETPGLVGAKVWRGDPFAPVPSAACHHLNGDTCEALKDALSGWGPSRAYTDAMRAKDEELVGLRGALRDSKASLNKWMDDTANLMQESRMLASKHARAVTLLRRVAERYPLQIVLDFLEKEGGA